jgi:chorismate mutase
MSTDLNDLRESLDNIDHAFICLLAERFRITQKIGRYKSEQGLPAVDGAREKVQFARIEKLALDRGLNPEFAAKMLRFIIDEVVANHQALHGAEG